MSQFFTLLTKTGQGLLANAIAYGEPLTIATMAIGDGGGKLPTPDATVTRLVNEVRRGPINQTAVDDDNPNWTVVEQVLPADVGGWTIREVGLYDTDGNLIAYGNYPETYKPQLSEGSSRTQTIRFVMEVTDTSAVTLRIDPSVVMASRQYVDESLKAHAESRNHPAADTKNSGMMRFATLTESKKGEETKAAQTPAGGMAQLDDHRNETAAHQAEQIALIEEMISATGLTNVSDVLTRLLDLTALSVTRNTVNTPYRRDGEAKKWQIRMGRAQIPAAAGNNGIAIVLPEAFETSFDFVYAMDRGNGANSVSCEVIDLGRFRAYGRSGSGDNPFAVTDITYLAFGGMS
ncbi:phage tail protein [Larsenimonas rhizosphaerae]|uniref:phage tail protein n=1 Tax=Larsenimonas rhizosphaerae TaxID=2944682 RepID=UPI0020336FAB|nr:phage tail protein [Larsenimonas rhizosphaerae]MCM2131463.1 phage tail protein [Larsenimonas rhizosphaerae]